MAPVEFEKELKKRLHSREAHPSEDAWDRIASRLDGEDPRRRRNPRWWMGLAAASVAFLAALVFFWEQPNVVPVTDTVVEAPGKEMPAAKKKQGIQPAGLAAEPQEAAVARTSEKEKSSGPLQVSEPEVALTDQSEGAAVSLGEHIPLEDTSRIDGLIARQLDTIHARVVAMENARESVSDAQIESLLREAQQVIAGQDSPEGQSSVDPGILLAEVEDELDQTFREQILEKLKREYTRIRNSVADRNN